MPTCIHRHPAIAVATAVLALILAGCGGQAGESAATSTTQPATSTQVTTSTPAPTTTGPGPMTAAELAWLSAIPKMHAKISAVFRYGPPTLTRSAAQSMSNVLGECRRTLRRIGRPTARLTPVLTLVNRACAQFDKGAPCWATVARVVYPNGGITVGTPQERTFNQAVKCGGDAFSNGTKLLAEAQMKGEEIKTAAG